MVRHKSRCWSSSWTAPIHVVDCDIVSRSLRSVAEALPGQLRGNLIDCEIVSHQQVESLWSDTEQVLKLFLDSSYAISSTATLSGESLRSVAEALPGQLRCILIDCDIVSHQQSSRFGPTQEQVLKLFLDSSYTISSTATLSFESLRSVAEALPGQLRGNLFDCDIVSHQQSSRFGPTQEQVLKQFLDSSYAVSSTATFSVESLRSGEVFLPGQLLCDLIACDIVFHQQVESQRPGAGALRGQLLCNLIDGDS